MNTILNNIGAGVLSVGMLVALAAPLGAHAALTEAQIQSILSLLNSFGADATTVANVDASLRGTTPTVTPGQQTSVSANVCPYTWTRSLTVGDTGADVLALQKLLNADPATTIAASGVGSVGNETNYFGSLTAAAVARFQNKYATEVLTPVGLTAGTGYFGPATRAKANMLCSAQEIVVAPPQQTSPPQVTTTPSFPLVGGAIVGAIRSTGGARRTPPPVVDTTPPEITLTGDTQVFISVGTTYTDQGATATDDVDGDITAAITVGGDTVDTSTAGTYTITYDATDAAGNAATQVTRTVVVQEAPTQDPTPPQSGDDEDDEDDADED